MNFFTHITISNILCDHITSQMELNRDAFIYGNVKPDLTRKLIQNPHILDNYLAYVCSSAENLMNGKASLEEFSVELGQICHYVCDFFCQYHLNIQIYNDFMDHFLYEVKLHFAILKLSGKEKFEMPINNIKVSRDISSIILDMRNDYSSKSDAINKDIYYAISASIWVCKSIAYFLAKSTEPISDSEIDSYAIPF